MEFDTEDQVLLVHINTERRYISKKYNCAAHGQMTSTEQFDKSTNSIAGHFYKGEVMQ